MCACVHSELPPHRTVSVSTRDVNRCFTHRLSLVFPTANYTRMRQHVDKRVNVQRLGYTRSGNVWVKPQEISKRDFMIWDFTVKPVEQRLRTTALSLAGGIVTCAVLFNVVSPSVTGTYMQAFLNVISVVMCHNHDACVADVLVLVCMISAYTSARSSRFLTGACAAYDPRFMQSEARLQELADPRMERAANKVCIFFVLFYFMCAGNYDVPFLCLSFARMLVPTRYVLLGVFLLSLIHALGHDVHKKHVPMHVLTKCICPTLCCMCLTLCMCLALCVCLTLCMCLAIAMCEQALHMHDMAFDQLTLQEAERLRERGNKPAYCYSRYYKALAGSGDMCNE